MRYRQITQAPATGSVERLTLVPLLPDGTLGALLPPDDDERTVAAGVTPADRVDDGSTGPLGAGVAAAAPLVLIHGDVDATDGSLHTAAAQIAADRAGLELGELHVVAAEGLPEAQHLIVWAEAWPSEQFTDRAAPLVGVTPDELRRRVSSDQGLIPGGASAAWIVADVAATIARQGGTRQ